MLTVVDFMDELWDLWNKNIDTVWRKALRKVWNLPFNTHCDILFELSNALPVCDVICNECYLLSLSVFIVTVTLLKRLLNMQFYMLT